MKISTDFQPYLLPGTTDPWSLPEEQSTLLLDYLTVKGITHIFCIPPIKQEIPENTPDTLRTKFLEFQQNNTGETNLRLAARYRLDNGFMQLLKTNDLLTIGENLVVDVSPLTKKPGTWEMIGSVRQSGYKPVIFQPERTTYWNRKDFDKLKAMDCDLVLNTYSLFGYNGDSALMYSRQLLGAGMYTYIYSGIEDTKIMRYSEDFSVEKEDDIFKAVLKLQENGRRLWTATK